MPRRLLDGSVLAARVAALSVLLLAGCHGGEMGGSGSPCALDKPCRAAFACVAGKCQPADGGLPDSPDLGLDRHIDAVIDSVADVLPPNEVGGEHPNEVEVGSSLPDGGPDKPDVPVEMPEVGPDKPEMKPDAGMDLPVEKKDGSTDGDGPADASDGPPTCSHKQPFSTITRVGGLSAGAGTFDGAARLSADELTIYFTSVRSSKYEIWTSTRASRTEDFEPPTKLSDLSSGTLDFNPSVTADGRTMYFETMRTGVFGIHTTTRSMPDGGWTTPVEFAPLAHVSPIGEGMPYVLPQGDALYFQSNRAGVLNIFRTIRDTGGTWSSPELVTGLTGDLEFSPVVPSDDLTLYFASDRDTTVAGDFDVWMATRATKTGAFTTPKRVEGVNTTMGETPSWISPDACRLYFARRMGNGSDSRIYMATRTPN